MQTPDDIDMRNRVLLERSKEFGDAIYNDQMRLVVRPNPDAARTYRWGFDIVQSSVWYAVALARWCADYPDTSDGEKERLNDIIQRMCGKQDRNPNSNTYGNIIWQWSWDTVQDRNGVSFWSPETGYIFTHHRNLLTAQTETILADTLTLCIEGLDRHRPRWQYTNIFLLNILSRLTLAKALDCPDQLDTAETDWHTWFTETDRGGLTEYNSPTYAVTALIPLARMLPLCQNDKMRSQTEIALEYLYADFCWHYHPALHMLTGATSRAYAGDWQRNSFSNLLAYQQFDAPLETKSMGGPFVALSSYQTSEANIARATQDKTGVTLRASIPDNNIRRITHFGDSFALGLKSGPSYGPQELIMTLAYPGRHQRMVTLKHQPETTAPVYADIDGNTGLLGIVYRAPPKINGSPHNWTRLTFGPPDHFSSIHVNGSEWNGDYCAITSGTMVSIETPSFAARFRFGFFPLGGEEPQTTAYLWHQYEYDLVVIELIAWQPALAALLVTLTETNDMPLPFPIHFDQNTLAAGPVSIPIPTSDGKPDQSTDPLLDTPDITWQKGDWHNAYSN